MKTYRIVVKVGEADRAAIIGIICTRLFIAQDAVTPIKWEELKKREAQQGFFDVVVDSGSTHLWHWFADANGTEQVGGGYPPGTLLYFNEKNPPPPPGPYSDAPGGAADKEYHAGKLRREIESDRGGHY